VAFFFLPDCLESRRFAVCSSIRDFGFDRPDRHPYIHPRLLPVNRTRSDSKLGSPNGLEIISAQPKALQIDSIKRGKTPFVLMDSPEMPFV
jgi:hypothetical protein